jgi:16S rRNA (cytosine967-C5)-methyltransferase
MFRQGIDLAVKSKARLYAYQALKKFDEGAPSIDPYVEKVYKRKLPRRDQALAIELILGIVRWLNKIDYILSCFSKRSLTSLDPPIRTALRLGIYQIVFLNRIPSSAATDESVELVKKDMGLSGASFVNGVLRRVSRSKKKTLLPERDHDEILWLSVQYSHPEWLINRWIKRFGSEEAERILAANNDHPPVSLWVNTRRFTVSEVVDRLRKEGVEVQSSRYLQNGFIVRQGYPYQTKIFKEGGFYIQDEASQFIPALYGESLSGYVADVCCAPGGKGMKMAHDAQDLFVVGMDISYPRLTLLKENLRRMRIEHFSPVMADARGMCPLKRRFDFVLVDAPCSGTGVIRRNPEIKWRLKEDDIKLFQTKQLALLADAGRVVKEKGFLLYSVCSLEEEENESVVDSFLRVNQDFQLENLSSKIPKKFYPFLDQNIFFRTYPHRDHMDGFFAALFKRKN